MRREIAEEVAQGSGAIARRGATVPPMLIPPES
jgi:hypothetical protein